MGLGLGIADVLVRDRIGDERGFLRVMALQIMVPPRHGIARRVQPALEPAGDGGPVMVVGHILLPRPDQLDRHLGSRRNPCRLIGEIRAGPPTKSAAQEQIVHLHIVGFELQRIGHSPARAERVLHPGPDFTNPVMNPGRAGHRFHRCMGEIGDAVFCLDRLLGGGQRCHRIPNFPVGIASLALLRAGKRSGLQGIDGRGADLVSVGLGKGQGYGVERLLGLPIAVGNHRGKITEVEHGDDARHFLRCYGIHFCDLAAPDRWCLDHRIFHAGDHRIDAELGGPIDLGRNVDARQRFAHQLIFGRFFQRRVGGRHMFRCFSGETGIGV